MHSRLLEYLPDIASLMPESRDQRDRADELALATALLDHVESGSAEAWLVELIDGATMPRRLASRVPLARLLGHAARRVLRGHRSLRLIAAGRMFGLELEGLSAEDQLFELARHFVRFARAAARHAALGHDTAGTPALRAALAAARRNAPGLVPMLTDLARAPESAVLDPSARIA